MNPPATSWRRLGAAGRIGLRFLVLYFALYTIPAPLTYVPDVRDLPQLWHGPDSPAEEQTWDAPEAVDTAYEWLGDLSTDWSELEQDAVDTAASKLLGFEQQLDRPYGSGDPTFSYVLMGLRAALALFLALLWSAVVRFAGLRDRFLAWVGPWIHVLGRYQLGFVLCGYGFAKVFPSQFRTPLLGRMETPYGDGSPMNILWSFMGSSLSYTVLAGTLEIIPGVLLFFRRTALLGALLGAAVMFNVAALNYCYDVPVKLYSTHLCILAIALAARDGRSLLNFFLSRRDVTTPDLRSPRTGWLGHGTRLLFIAPYLAFAVDRTVDRYSNPPEPSELYGIWDVVQFDAEGATRIPRTDDPLRFQSLIVDRSTLGWLKTMDGSLRRLDLGLDGDAETITLGTSSYWDMELRGDELILVGEYARTFREDPSDFSDPGEARDPQFRITLAYAGPVPEDQLPDQGAETSEQTEPAPEDVATEQPEETTSLQAFQGRWTRVSEEAIGDLATRRRSTPSNWEAVTIHADGTCIFEYPLAKLTFRATLGQEEQDGSAHCGRITIESGSPLEYSQQEDGTLVLTGNHRGADVRVLLEPRAPDSFLLQRRGYHWINEIPINRY